MVATLTGCEKDVGLSLSGQLLSEVTKMKKVYEGIASFVRWLLAGVFSFIIVLPTWVSLTYEI